MAESRKFLNRPKVRFCQSDDDDQEHDINQRISIPSRKPSIRNIESVENPYKIISLDENFSSKNSEQFSEKRIFDEEEFFTSSLRKLPSPSLKEKTSTEFVTPIEYKFDDKSSSFDSSVSSKEEIPQNPKIIEVEVHTENFPNSQIQNEPESFPEDIQPFLNSKDKLFKDPEPTFTQSLEKKNLSSIQEESLEFEASPKENCPEPEILNIPEDLKLTKKTSEPKSPRKTFKCTSPLKKQLNSINRLSKSVKSPKKSILQENAKNQKSLTTNSKTRTRPLGSIQRSATKPKVSGVMPCLKARVATKVKTSPVKKTVLRNVATKPIKVFIGPGNSRPKKELKIDFEKESKANHQTMNPEKLSRPEYNSIMCTINKLKEVQKENIITDVEHLPPTYKSLINGKVANSLDFPPDESIFKNLINLSIDESQLPPRLTRSKDPEPRQRDAVPKLSDFFIPKYANEYCTAVCVKPKSPEPIENWNAFKISDKIRSWKWNMDFVH